MSVMERVAERAPMAEGVKATTMVQLEPAAREAPQVLFCTKSAELAPVTASPERASEVEPVLVSVTVCAELVMSTASLAKARLEGERLALAEVLEPVPERLRVCGLPVALSATLRVALRVPVAAGLKVTLIVQLAPAATLDPQVLV